VIVFGAFVRLSNAGLSCPDWPTCYGRATWPAVAQDVSEHAASAIRPFETHKAWREQVHRMIAGLLGVLVLTLALLAARRRTRGLWQVGFRGGAGGGRRRRSTSRASMRRRRCWRSLARRCCWSRRGAGATPT
jgi:heme A synthase